MRTYGELKILTAMQDIKEAMTVKWPSPHFIRTSTYNEGVTRGYSAAIWNRSRNQFDVLPAVGTEEQIMENIFTRKKACIAFPDVFGNWYTEIGDIFIFRTDAYAKPNWGLHAIVIEGCEEEE